MKRLANKPSAAGFTVLELIIVMSLAIFMAAGTLMGFSSITSNSKLGKAGGIVEGAMRQARSYAVANSRDVIIVFATNGSITNPTNIDDDIAHRGICVFDPVDNDYVVQWKTVPRGTGFSKITESGGGSSGVPVREIPYRGKTTRVQWVWLSSNGTLVKPLEVTISQGAVLSGKFDTTKVYGSGPKDLIVNLNWAGGSL